MIDKKGIIRYVDVHDIDDQPDNEILFKEIEKVEPILSAVYRARMASMISEPIPEDDIVVFCTPWCPDCKKLRQYLDQCGESFSEVDISRNLEGAKLVRQWCGGKEITPVIQIRGSEPIVDFDPEKIDAALRRLHGDS